MDDEVLGNHYLVVEHERKHVCVQLVDLVVVVHILVLDLLVLLDIHRHLVLRMNLVVLGGR